MNNFINFVKKFLMEEKMRVEIKASKEIKTLLLLVLNLLARSWVPASLFYFIKIAKKLM